MIKRPRMDNGMGKHSDTASNKYRRKHGVYFEPTIPYGTDRDGVGKGQTEPSYRGLSA